METTKFTIEVDWALPKIRQAYYRCFDEKPKDKKAIANWLGALCEADIQDFMD